jgi:hypothetical protein
MSLPPPQYRFETPLIHISAWDDPIVDQLGHDPRSPYVEQFWLPILGPSTTFLMRHLSARLDEEPEGFDLSVDDTARLLGLGTRSGLGSPFIRAMARTGQFRLTRPCGPDAIEVRRRLPGLSSPQISRLPAPVRDAHDAWQRAANQEPTIEQRRTRARRLALSLLELGEDTEAAEQQLHRWRIHPAMAHEALRWAQIRRGLEPPAVPAPVAMAAADRTGPPALRAAMPPGARPKIGATRPAPVASFSPYDPPDAA